MTYPYDENTIYWPNAKPFKLTIGNWGFTEKGYYYAANEYNAAEHGGTHVDAPIHFAEHGRTINQIPLQEWISPAVKIDMVKKCEENRDYLLQVDDILNWEKEYGTIPDGIWVIMYTGIDTKYYPNKESAGDKQDRNGSHSRIEFPGIFVRSGGVFDQRKRYHRNRIGYAEHRLWKVN